MPLKILLSSGCCSFGFNQQHNTTEGGNYYVNQYYKSDGGTEQEIFSPSPDFFVEEIVAVVVQVAEIHSVLTVQGQNYCDENSAGHQNTETTKMGHLR